jgi:hypothetical protein
MSGTLPNNSFRSVKVTEVTPTMVTTAVSGKSQRKQILSQFFRFEIAYPVLTREQAKPVIAFLNKQRNSLYDFTMTIPEIGSTDGTVKTVIADNPAVSTTIATTASASKGDSSVTFDSDFNSALFTSSGVDATQGLLAGDFIKFTGHNKVYKVTDDVTFNATGGGTISIFPNLFADVANAEQIKYNNIDFTVYSVTQDQEVNYALNGKATITLKLQESI